MIRRFIALTRIALMKINDDHMYHGAALTQVAEHPQFTAINAFQQGGHASRSGFLVNHDIGVYLKYASEPTKPYSEYHFTFHADHLAELEALNKKAGRVFIVLVCVRAKEICCITYVEFEALIAKRRVARGATEDSYLVLVTCPQGKSFRVYVNAPGQKKKALGNRIVPRNRFPNELFA